MLYCESQIKDKNYTEADISLLTRDMIYTGKHQVNLALHTPLFYLACWRKNNPSNVLSLF